ncbi:MAG TPA: nitroreductase family deazaflavin-dependent oxidoreductase [Actinomycetota bacterium]
MAEANDWNTNIIEEFRANGGKVGGPFEGAPLLLLHTTGARSGAERVNPLMYLPDGDRLVVFASKGGAPDNPDWYHNVLANPGVSIEVGDETVDARATVADDTERDTLFAEQARRYPQFQGYQDGIDRTIPVVILERAS